VPKRLELLGELVPTAAVIAFLVNPNNPNADPDTREAQAAARTTGRELVVLRAGSESDVESVFATLVQQRAGVLMISADALFFSQRDQLVALAGSASV
jgi:putative tryptophan/tyrosine transport system substrate-binding protein